MRRAIACLLLPIAALHAQEVDLDRAIADLGSARPEERRAAVRDLLAAGAPARRAVQERLAPELFATDLDEASRAAIDGWIEELGDPEFDIREAAEANLRGLGRSALAELEGKAAGIPDQETRFRVERIVEDLRSLGVADRAAAAGLEGILFLGTDGDPSSTGTLLAVLGASPGLGGLAAHLSLRAIHPGGPTLDQLEMRLDTFDAGRVARGWRAWLADRPAALGSAAVGPLTLPADRIASASSELLTLGQEGDRLPAAEDGLPVASRVVERSVFVEEDVEGAIRRTYREQSVTTAFGELGVGGGENRLGERVVDLQDGPPVVIVASDEKGPLGPGDKLLISLGSFLRRMIPPGEYEAGRPVEMPGEAVRAILPYIEDGTAFDCHRAAGRLVHLGEGAFDAWSCFDVSPAAGAGTGYRVWLVGRFEVEGDALTAYRVTGMIQGFAGGPSVTHYLFRTAYDLAAPPAGQDGED